MLKDVFVIAGSYEEYRRLIRSNKYLSVNLVDVPDADCLRGRKGIKFLITDLGLQRKDLKSIYETLVMANIGTLEEHSIRALKMELLLYA